MGNVEIPNWLKGLPLAPVYRPTDTEFADPIAYISRIEKEASAFGICKIIPPLPKPSKKYVFHNLNKSLSRSPELGTEIDFSKIGSSGEDGDNAEVRAVFTTRQQELGQNGKRTRDLSSLPCFQKQVWQSGEVYTLEQFESKSKAFARNQLGSLKEISPLVIEALFWKAATDRPIYIEYANDVPGSGFGEPDIKCHAFHRRRRKRGSYRREKSLGSEGSGITVPKNTTVDDQTKMLPAENVHKPLETSNLSITSSHDEASRDMEGTAGWRLANSPWNLQVIARSAGSLTRFMPDDIPGVTSPMVYVGMLFSWFAWHIEDHELHSMNFLHTGSAKTWYAVPGDNVFDFEEVIRTEAYGGNLDRLATLSLLGEKTTLLSPEVVVSAGIPCCRLIQYPGEFVVTFPRAYHIGFSHGFNCGEAANFGTSQWLKVAREAAVRRAAMNYLPMLSHQQLLYLLTMSFVSRVPRSLLPGARSSRLKDRLREERELLVKRAFIEDMLRENKTLSIVLDKGLTHHAVLWDPDLLPRQGKDSQVTNPGTVCFGHTEKSTNDNQKSLLEELSLFMENLNDLYLDEDDTLLNDFHVDYGTLACVACGILGFPFMAVVQPSENASKDMLIENALEEPSVTVGNQYEPAVGGKQPERLANIERGWSANSRWLRPRIFCLEHTLQVQKLLHPKGGANVLVICHKDFQKIKAHATTVAEEVAVPFVYTDVPLEDATEEELKLIDLAIDDEENDECGEDWTSKLGINLQFCVKVRKVAPAKKVQHALELGGLFNERNHNDMKFLKLSWQCRSRRSRLGAKSNLPPCHRTSENDEVKSDPLLGVKSGSLGGRLNEKLIQYSRRKKLNLGTDADQRPSLIVKVTTKDGLRQETMPDEDHNSGKNTLVDLHMPASSVRDDGSRDCSELQAEGICPENKLQGEANQCSGSDTELVRADRTLTQPLCVLEEESSDGKRERCTTLEQDDAEMLEDESDYVKSRANQTETVADRTLCNEMEKHDLGKSCGEEELCSGSPRNVVRSENLPSTVSRDELVTSAAFEAINDPSEPVGINIGNDMRAGNTFTVSDSFSLEKEAGQSGLAQCESAPAIVELMVIESGEARKRNGGAASETGNRSSFIRSPCEGLRPRVGREEGKEMASNSRKTSQVQRSRKKVGKASPEGSGKYRCNVEGCGMTLETKEALQMHKRNRCPYQGCGKRFRAHKYAVLHQRVHEDERPLKCPWKGCGMSFKWAWARTEHIRLHTGERPYKCQVEGCGLSFRFVSDFSRHRRKTGHYV